jgi:hypothetical protein
VLSNLTWRSSLYYDMLILHQSYHGNYACILERVVVFDADGMNSSTQVCVVRREWVPVAMSPSIRQ